MQQNTKRYIIAFVIAAAIFGTALVVTNMLNNVRIAQVQTIEDNIATDILSLETQFELLSELSCKDIRENSVLSQELADVSRRVAYTEEKLGAENPEVLRLKRQYTLLQIKDLLLMKKVSQKCGLQPVFVLYFYSNQNDCPDCERQGYALTSLGESYPKLRIYSFDYHLDLPALKTLLTINDLNGELPALIINEKPYYGFKSIDELKKLIPKIDTLTGTSTRSK
ncbi:hypothetical protein HY413_02775 [Candidatus Kaiserbacteria bacterium]|nr:hypothetical protein [Candidatus Kaiserbacteria bacterium]